MSLSGKERVGEVGHRLWQWQCVCVALQQQGREGALSCSAVSGIAIGVRGVRTLFYCTR